MANSYPIWCKINSCAYANYGSGTGNKSFGIKKHSDTEIRVGTSSKNSHHFLSHRTTCRDLPNGDRSFHFYIDDKLFKSALLKSGEQELSEVKVYFDLG